MIAAETFKALVRLRRRKHSKTPAALRAKGIARAAGRVQQYSNSMSFWNSPKPLGKGQNHQVAVCKEGKVSGVAIRGHGEVGTRSNRGGGKLISCLKD